MIMTPRERIINTLDHKETDRLPWAPLIDDYYISYLESIGVNMNIVEFLRYIGADVIKRHVPVCRLEYKGGVEKVEKRQGEDILTAFHTPIGSISQVSRFINNSSTIIEYFIKSREDLKVLQYVEENKSTIGDYKTFKEEDDYIGSSGIATASASSTPLSTLFEFFMGLENFIYYIYDYPNDMEELMELMHENNIREHRVIAQSPSPVIFMYEDTSTTTISRDLYTKYCKGQIDDYADVVHGEGKHYIVHMCGKLKGLADIIAKNRMDGIDSLCPPTSGDFWAHEALESWKDKIIIGGLEPAKLQQATVDELFEYVMHIIKDVSPYRNLILCTGDATAYGTPIENLKLITDLVNKYGHY